MMNKLKIIVGAAAILSLFLQCACPNVGSYPVGGFEALKYSNNNHTSKVDLLDEWTTIDSKWHFKDGGELTISSQSQKTNAYWIDGKNSLEIIIKGESTVYNVEVISERELKLSTNDLVVVLKK